MSARVMVVDDILPNVKLLEAKLMSEYYDVITAESGPEALEKLQEEQPDIILLDVMMPGMDGFEVCRRIKADPKIAHIPIVMVTALTDKEDRVKGLEAGADDFLSKPINDVALMARVRSLVRLKMTIDEWRVRENTARQLGVSEDAASVMQQPVDNAKILIIEDQDFEIEKFGQTLQVDDDQVYFSTNGMDALKKVAEQPFDLLIVSLNLENEDGLRLSSHLRSNETTRAVPILMVGSEDDMDKVARGLEMGAHDYVLRPVDRNEFLARVRTQIRRKRYQEKLRSNYESNLTMAIRDPLTGLYNRRYMETHMAKLLEKQAENHKPMGVLLLDIDHFKSVNDTHGHGAGDDVLKEFSKRLSDNLRGFDLIARLGGEEFVAILPDVSEEKAYFIAERLRRSICEVPFTANGGELSLSISSSIGGAIIHRGGHLVHSVLERADKCLYHAKEHGRNCTIFERVGLIDPNKYKEIPRSL